MTPLLESPPFWAFLGATITPLLLGIGWVIKRLATHKDESAKKLDEQMIHNREEAQALNEKYMQRTEELMELRADRRYLEKLLERCERELSELKRDRTQ